MIAGKHIRAKTEENLKTGCFAVKLKHSDGQASYDKNEKLEAELVNYHLSVLISLLLSRTLGATTTFNRVNLALKCTAKVLFNRCAIN